MPQSIRSRARDNPEVRREQIVEEAIRVIGQRGYYGFTVQQIAERCGVTNGGLLYHFGSKEELLLAVLKERDRRETAMINSVAGRAAQEAERNDSSLGAVLNLLRAIVERGTAQPELTRLYMVLQSEALDQAHPAHGYFRAREAMVLEAFAKMLAPHVPRPRVSARQIYALMDGLIQLWLRSGQTFDIVVEWGHAVAMLLPGPEYKRRRRAIT
jgi:AcrR family transcriptional regulator